MHRLSPLSYHTVYCLQPHPTYLSRVELCTELFYATDHAYLVSMLFADLLSLHLVTFLMFFILAHVTFF